ncbi:DoxX family protein [Bdellovibrio sp. BCCA]|uniref:DoxX family protein n=1 Tax=Bdellovibrio sp. BCCA TaxID=3136281 RepID=UPI0040403BEF
MILKTLATDKSLTEFFLRVALGAMILPHGLQKTFGAFGGYGYTGTMQFFTDTMGIPAPFAFMAIAAEFAGGFALILGIGTRWAALLVGAVMAVAALTSHVQNGFFMNWFGNQKGEGWEFHLLAIAIAVALVVRGGGAYSTDLVVSKKLS